MFCASINNWQEKLKSHRCVCYGSLLWAFLVLRVYSAELRLMLYFHAEFYKASGFSCPYIPLHPFEQQICYTVAKRNLLYKNGMISEFTIKKHAQRANLEKRVSVLTSRSWHIILARSNLGNCLWEYGQNHGILHLFSFYLKKQKTTRSLWSLRMLSWPCQC